MVICQDMPLERKLEILSDAAKYDVSCTSSGVDRSAVKGKLGDSSAMGICHSFAADGRCISLLKILYTNECIFDCKYCINRSSNDVVRTSFTPEEVCRLTMEFYRRNYIEGLFLSSGVMVSPNYTLEQLLITLRLLRDTYGFMGYIHVKVIPGGDPALVEMLGWYADRLSVNLELPTAEGLRQLAPHKSRKNILTPMRQIQGCIDESRNRLGMMGGNRSAFWHTKQRLAREGSALAGGTEKVLADKEESRGDKETNANSQAEHRESVPSDDSLRIERRDLSREVRDLTDGAARGYLQFAPPQSMKGRKGFAVGGQSTQMIIGATQETDYQLIQVAEALYQSFDLKRVFYSAFVKVNDDSRLPDIPGGPPLLREHRLYQADWLFRYYGFSAGELLSEKQPNFNVFLDPKCDWAIRNLHHFPVEVTTADYFTLLRVPGIGPKSARRIISTRRSGRLDFAVLKRLGVVLKRAKYFLTCNGRMQYGGPIGEDSITNCLIGEDSRHRKGHLDAYGAGYRQISLFDCSNCG